MLVVLSVLVVAVVAVESLFLPHDPISATVQTIKANQNTIFFIMTSLMLSKW